MKKYIIALIIIICTISIATAKENQNTIRFRVIANSNEETDQELKKDIVKRIYPKLLNVQLKSNTIEETRSNLKYQIPEYAKIVEKTISEKNSNETYHINYGMNKFPEKELNGQKYKEGEYESLVITLGNGLGDNFWCILFPPLCLMEATEEETQEVEYTSFFKELLNKYF